MSPTGPRRLLLIGALAAAAGLGACVAYPDDYGYGGYGDSYAYNDYGYGYSRPSYSYYSRYSSPRSYSYPRYYGSRGSYYYDDRGRYRRSYYSGRDDGWSDGNRRYARRYDDDNRRYVHRYDGDNRGYDRGSSRGASRNPYYFYRPGHENDR